MDVKLLLPEEVLAQWPEIAPLVSSFLDKGEGESTVFDIAQKCISMQYQCWIVTDEEGIVCVCITKIDEHPTFKSLHIIGVAGSDWPTWRHFHSNLEGFAKFNDCKRITQWGRKGWVKQLQNFEGQHGEIYKEIHTVMAMDLITDQEI